MATTPFKILVTGAAGYIGGSIVADFIASNRLQIKKENIFAAVRSEEQAEAISRSGITVLQLDLTDEGAVVASLLRYDISIVIHTASSIDAGLALPLITGLGKQREVSGKQTYFIHTSALSAFYERTGWPHGETKDAGPVFDTEKQLADSFPIRKVSSIFCQESALWGTVTAERVSGVHISDITTLYERIVEKVLQKEELPSGTEGYYFALAHDLVWWEVLDRLGIALKARGLVTSPETQIWPNDEVAAESMGVPVKYLQPLWNSGENIVSEKPTRIGWKPLWNNERFLENIDDEIQAVLDLGKAKSSLIDSLFESTKA
ncbi:MAG: hypothetical protein M1820_004808 [Bogoriella megaspora]|nr:MAG: hypothetical protein M1820_004808 [Bogoriella megaspora]